MCQSWNATPKAEKCAGFVKKAQFAQTLVKQHKIYICSSYQYVSQIQHFILIQASGPN